ncbi:unnamed protein product [Jaminaea pallidilutea]
MSIPVPHCTILCVLHRANSQRDWLNVKLVLPVHVASLGSECISPSCQPAMSASVRPSVREPGRLLPPQLGRAVSPSTNHL